MDVVPVPVEDEAETGGVAIVPETDPNKLYEYLIGTVARRTYDAAKAEHTLSKIVRPLRPLQHEGQWFIVRLRLLEKGEKEYTVKSPGDEKARLTVVVGGPFLGLSVPERLEGEGVSDDGLGAALFAMIAADMGRVGARFWPSPPDVTTGWEFRIWWRYSRCDVGFYPHVAQLGLKLEGEEADDIEYFMHLVPAERVRDGRKLAEELRTARNKKGYGDAVVRLLNEGRRWGHSNGNALAEWMNTAVGLTTWTGKAWTGHMVYLTMRGPN